jgi:DNA-binding NarL/FixJ family response regulator
MENFADGGTLFIDDASWLLDSFRSTLNRLGYTRFATAASPRDARDILKSDRISHVVSDLRMPSERGDHFLLDLKRERPDLKCTVLTGFADDLSSEDRAALKAAGIAVKVKSQVDTQFVAQLVGIDWQGSPVGADLSIPQVASDNSTETTSPSDTIAAYRLELDTALQNLANKERLVRFLAQDFLDELQQYDNRDAKTVIGSNESLSVNDLIEAIQQQSPFGLRLIELDRAARRRLR